MNDTHAGARWSETELDAALAALHADPATVPTGTGTDDAGTDIELGLPADVPVLAHRRRRWAYPAVAAGVAGALVAGGLVVGYAHRSGPTGGSVSAGASASAPESAVAQLDRLADRTATVPNPVARPGQYLYVNWTIDEIITGSGPTTRQTTQERTWIPADPNGTWRKTTVTGAGRSGDTENARCGDFYAVENDVPVDCGRAGTKQVTPLVVAAMPRDPAKLLRWLRARNSDQGPTAAMPVAAMYLETGLVPPDLRAAIYRAMALQPGLTATDVTVGGHRGVAFGWPAGAESVGQQFVVDPGTGGYLGYRELAGGSVGSVPLGTPLSTETVTVQVVDQAGATR
jgi:hypothetical protein